VGHNSIKNQRACVDRGKQAVADHGEVSGGVKTLFNHATQLVGLMWTAGRL
jgi:hypothetical protein